MPREAMLAFGNAMNRSAHVKSVHLHSAFRLRGYRWCAGTFGGHRSPDSAAGCGGAGGLLGRAAARSGSHIVSRPTTMATLKGPTSCRPLHCYGVYICVSLNIWRFALFVLVPSKQ